MGTMPVANPSPPSRLRFPQRGLRVGLLLFALVILTTVAIAFAWPSGSKVDQRSHGGWVTVGRTEDFEVFKPVRNVEHRFWLVKLRDEQFVALLSRSPHRGCAVPWRPEFEFQGTKGWFRDPCSGSTWDVTGHLAFGPSPRDMDRFSLRIVDGRVEVMADPAPVILGSHGGPVATSR